MENLKKQLKYIDRGSECIILIHGLARTSRCMNKAASILTGYGYDIINVSYPSRNKSVERLVKEHIQPVVAQSETKSYRHIHFMTHSMGGILLRLFFSHNSLENLGRIVMLAPPNQGSEVVDKLAHLRLFSLLNGPAGLQLGTDANSILMQLKAVDFDLGIIAGYRSINPLLSLLIPGENDGKVAVARTKISGMKDLLLVPSTHSFIMQRTLVIQQVLAYIQQGCFYR